MGEVKEKPDDPGALLRRAQENDPDALGQLLLRYTNRLRALVRIHLDPRLRGRVDASDVIQETFLDASRTFPQYREKPATSFYCWLRCIAERRIIDIHRRHLGVQARDPRKEVPLQAEGLSDVSSAALAAGLQGGGPTPSEIAVRVERASILDAALEKLDPADREVLALRHFEGLTNAEAAEVLGISEAAATKRHLRALLRLKDSLKNVKDAKDVLDIP
jgi:RNA polymerase sigma-70 factor, ECF subfamily